MDVKKSIDAKGREGSKKMRSADIDQGDFESHNLEIYVINLWSTVLPLKGLFRLGVGAKANMSQVACKWVPKAPQWPLISK